MVYQIIPRHTYFWLVVLSCVLKSCQYFHIFYSYLMSRVSVLLTDNRSKKGCRGQIFSGLLCLFSFLGLGPICDEVRIWASNLIHFYLFIESLSRFCISCLSRVYFVSSYLSLNVKLCHFVSCHVFRSYSRQMSFYLFNYVS